MPRLQFDRDAGAFDGAGSGGAAAGGVRTQQLGDADQLVTSEATVCTRVSNILGKLQLASHAQAALYALREGIAGLEEP